jgi:hypothetical protein
MKTHGRTAEKSTEEQTADRLDALIADLETVRWPDVPGVSTVTAVTFADRLREARREIDPDRERLVADGGVSISRRRAMQAVGALAAGRWAQSEYDIEDADEWDPVDGTGYGGFSHEISEFNGNGYTYDGWGGFDLWDTPLDETVSEVLYGRDGVSIVFQGSNDDLEAGMLARFSPGEAQAFAASVFMAAEELDRRGVVDA